MTNKEAIERFSVAVTATLNIEEQDLYRTAIIALEKHIPKKPVPSVLYDAKFWCVCGFGIKQQYEDTMFKIQYCPWCGQRLNWSEEK